MKNISLIKLSITVVVASLASNLVFANNEMKETLPKVEQPVSSFSQLISHYDVDKNNTLSLEELAKNHNLTKFFSQLDANGDKQLSEQEFNQYLAQMKKSLS